MNKYLALLFPWVLAVNILQSGAAVASSQKITAEPATIHVIDGDTIQIGKTVLQLSGIDAPELGQKCRDSRGHGHCGLDSAFGLKKLVTLGKTPAVVCFPTGNKNIIIIANCLRGHENLSVAILNAGHAVVVPEGSPSYDAAEAPFLEEAQALAKAASMGNWSKDFILPWEWRRQREDTGSTPTQNQDCIVKGKVSKEGRRFYFSPMDPEYEKIVINPNKGDRFFCSDDQARAAGWTRVGEETGLR